ncbi:MAG TPA: Rid family detoxifying hydrolase [Candidatus Acidoferrum sp.]|nr:Rid family detoxifying hydrolase [Candidatus Acidoferrum sp.]
MSFEIISTDKAPRPTASYSQATKFGKFLFTAGQIPHDPKSGEIVGSTIEEQTRQTLENLKNLLEAAGYSISDVLKVLIFLKRTDDFAGMNRIYSEYFKTNAPARSTVQAQMMNPKLLIELEAIACKS